MSTLNPLRRRRPRASFDPETQPVVESASLSALPGEALELDFIREAFSTELQWQVEPLFHASFGVELLDLPDVIPAAVFFPLVQRSGGLHVIFTRRSPHLHDHAGQICFPGGRIEPGDSGAIAAALRETREEIGVSPEFIQLLGTHPGLLTSTRFTMKPVIGLVLPGFTIEPDHTEVAEVFEVPLSVLMDPLSHRLHQARLADGTHRFYFSISWKSYFIWGATAALVRNFYHYLAAARTVLRP